MTKARIREIRAASRANSAHQSIIAELLDCIEKLQSRTRRGEEPIPPEELPLAAKVNEKKKAKGTREEIIEYAADLDLEEDDAIWFYEKMIENDWKVGKQPVKDWRGRLRTWKAGKFFPSQKNGQHGAPAKTAGPARCIL